MNSRCTTTCKACCIALLAIASTTNATVKDGDVVVLSKGDHTEFSFVTPLGWVRFTVSSEWHVASVETKGPLKVALFQISNEARDEMSDAANVGVILYQIDSKEASDALAMMREKVAKGQKSRFDQWEVFAQEFKQADATYSMRTAFRDIADVHVAVRVASPLSSKNPAIRKSEMEQTLRALLKSVIGEVGQYKEREDEVVRPSQ